MAISRRRFLCGCGGSLVLSALAGGRVAWATATAPKTTGCILNAATTGSTAPGCGTVATTGNAQLDAAFQREFEQQRNFFNLPDVQWQFVDDCNGDNAFSAPGTRTIYFGIHFAKNLYSTWGSTLPLWQVLAHEFGHQMQFTYGDLYSRDTTNVHNELEADMFSGFYLGSAKNSNPTNEIRTILPLAFAFGDTDYNAPNHHGTNDQRVAAVLHGVVVAYEWYSGAIENTVEVARERFAWRMP